MINNVQINTCWNSSFIGKTIPRKPSIYGLFHDRQNWKKTKINDFSLIKVFSMHFRTFSMRIRYFALCNGFEDIFACPMTLTSENGARCCRNVTSCPLIVFSVIHYFFENQSEWLFHSYHFDLFRNKNCISYILLLRILLMDVRIRLTYPRLHAPKVFELH